jgi:hypothetical protein
MMTYTTILNLILLNIINYIFREQQIPMMNLYKLYSIFNDYIYNNLIHIGS